MVYIKVNGRYKTIKEIAAEFNMPLDLIKGRAHTGIRDIKKLTQPNLRPRYKDRV